MARRPEGIRITSYNVCYTKLLRLDFADVVADPETAARRMNDFVGGHLDIEKMALQVDPNLYRNRA